MKEVLEIDLNKLLNRINLNYETFVELCILMGTDYSDKSNYTFEYIYNLLVNNSYNITELVLPEGYDIIKTYFMDPLSTKYINANFVSTYRFANYELNKISEFLNKNKNILINEMLVGKFINIINKSLFTHNLKKR